MSNPLTSGRWTRALTVAVAMGFCLVAHGQDTTDPNNGYGPNDRPVHAFISMTDTFDLPNIATVDRKVRNQAGSMGSKVICLKIGRFVAGDQIETSRYLSDDPATFDPLDVLVQPGPDLQPGDFEDNHVTMIGGFKTLEPDNAIHLMSPYPQPISQNVQKAYFNASPFFETGLPTVCTTVQVALFIFDNQGGAGASINSILQEIFFVDLAAPVVLGPPPPAPAPPILTGGGVFFPHKPGQGQFGFDIDLDLQAGILDADVALNVEIDVKPGNSNNIVNVKDDSGVLSILVMNTEGFDAAGELDPDSVVAVVIGTDGEIINEVSNLRFVVGNSGVTYKFSMKALVDGPNAPITTTTTIVTLRGKTNEGMSVQGSDTIQIVPK